MNSIIISKFRSSGLYCNFIEQLFLTSKNLTLAAVFYNEQDFHIIVLLESLAAYDSTLPAIKFSRLEFIGVLVDSLSPYGIINCGEIYYSDS